MHSINLLLHYPSFFLVCLFTAICTRTFWHDQYARGFTIPHQYGVRNPNTFDDAVPRTYNTICISSESCLWSNVGFARLLCFGTLRSALSVALGELLRLCPGSTGLSTSVEKAKTDCHGKAGDWSLFGEVFQVPKDLCCFGRGAGPVRLTGVYRAPN